MTVKVAAYFDVPEDKADEVTYAVMTLLSVSLPYMADNVEILQEEA